MDAGFRGSPIRDKVSVGEGKKVCVFFFLSLFFFFSCRKNVLQAVVFKVSVLIAIRTTKVVAAFQRPSLNT